MKTSSHQSSNYDYTGRSVIIQQQQQQQEQQRPQFVDDPQSVQSLLDGYLGSQAVLPVQPEQPQYVVDVDPSSDDVAVVSSSAPSVSVGRRRSGGGLAGCSGAKNVAGAGGGTEVVVVEDDGQALPRYPTIQFAAGPSRSNRSNSHSKPVLISEDVSVVPSSGRNFNNHSGESVVVATGESGSTKYNAQPQQQVVIAKVTSAKRKRDTGEWRKLRLMKDAREREFSNRTV